ncbi:unnamed protein product [Urochloa humidicola]
MGHPYSPAELQLPGYVPLQLSQGQILVPYLGISLLVVLHIWLVSGKWCRGLSKTDRLLMCWWEFTGLTHIIIEGTFVFAPGFFRKENPNYFNELWKEYSKGDSRYVARDTATLTVEAITAVLEGPASLLAVYAIATHKSYSHILQFAVCLGQLYGCLVYFITAYFGWIQLLGQSILLLGIFHWRKQFLDLDTNTHRHEELEEDLCSLSN